MTRESRSATNAPLQTSARARDERKLKIEKEGRKLPLRRRVVYVLVALVVLITLHDWLQPRNREITTFLAVSMIEEYREHVSPRLEGRVFCRFEPTCSKYGLESVREHGAVIGGAKSLWRILRCGPWTPEGTVDPP